MQFQQIVFRLAMPSRRTPSPPLALAILPSLSVPIRFFQTVLLVALAPVICTPCDLLPEIRSFSTRPFLALRMMTPMSSPASGRRPPPGDVPR
jgi:hypothetical protein